MNPIPFAAFAASIISATQALAGPTVEPVPAEPDPSGVSEWQWRVSLPVWAGVPSSGDASTGGVDASLDMDAADVVSLIDSAAALSIEARNGRWSFAADGMYLRLADTVQPTGPLIESGRLEIEQTLANAAVGYRFVDGDAWSLDALMGARYNHVGLKFDVNFAPGAIGDRHVDDSKDWVDPFLGLQTRARVFQAVTLVAKGDVGGFGVGSDLTWQLYAGLEFQLTRCMWGGVGWRHLRTDFQDGRFKYDVSTTGPVLELGINF